VTQNRDHQAAITLFFEDLICNHIHEFALFGVELDGVAHSSDDDELIEGTIDEIGYAETISTFNEFGRILC